MKKHFKDYFIPHEGNEYKPHSLQKAAVIGMAALVLITFSVANLQSFVIVTSDWMLSAVLPSVIVEMVNDERADGSLGVLKRNEILDAAAQAKADDMAKYQYFAHFSPTGVSPWFFFNQKKYNFVNAGENLAVYFTDTSELVDAWIKSPTHRANIMNGRYTETGIGIAEGTFEGYPTMYIVQFFGTPASTPVVASVKDSPLKIAQAAEVEPVASAVVDTEILGVEDEILPDTPIEIADINTDIVPEIAETPNESTVLSEFVSITEDVVIVEAEPVALEQEKEILVLEARGPDLELEFISTTTGAVPASLGSSDIAPGSETSSFFKILTQPSVVLQVSYIVIGLLVLVSLIFSVFIEIRKQHPVQIVYSLALLLLMFGLFKIYEILSVGIVVI